VANPNPFLRSPTDTLVDELNAQAAQPVTLPEVPKAAPAPKADIEPPATPSMPKAEASAKTPNWLPNANLMPIFESAAQQYNVPVNVVMALANQESRYNPNAIGQQTEWGRAKGIMQYLDSTANGLGINPFDPAEAIPAAAKQIRERLDKGYSMEDAVKEHFAGPDRAKWGQKTATYGREVMEKVGKIGDALGAAPAADSTASSQSQVDLAQLQKDLDGDDAGRYKVLTDDFTATHFSPALMDRGAYEQTFRQNNPGASQAAVDYAMGEYDKQAQQRAAAPTVENRFKMLQDPNAMFDQRLNQKLAGRGSGIVPALPDLQAATAQPTPPAPKPTFDPAKAEEESGFSAGASYLGRSLQSGMYDVIGAGARILDAMNPWTLSPSDAAVLYKDDPAKLKQMQDAGAALILDRFARSMTQNAEEAQAAMSDRAKRDYAGLEYATTDLNKAAYTSPVKVIGDAVRSLPTTAAMAVSVYLTRGAALQAEKQALAAGLGEEAARRAAVQAGAKVMSGAGAVTEGATGYAQQVNQSTSEASKLSMSEIAKSPKFQQLVQEGFSPEAARAKIIADTGEQAGQIAGIVDAAVNHVGGEFLGKILTEGGKLIPRIMKGAANEAATETVQSAGEQVGGNRATQQNINPNQDLSQGVGEAAAAGAAVGGLMGGVTAGAGGRGHTEQATQQPAAQPAAQTAVPAAAPIAPPTQVAPIPAAAVPAPKSSTPLTSSVERSAEQPQRVVGITKDGATAVGAVREYREDGDGKFLARIVGDDGQVYTVTDEDGVQLVPVEEAKGPLSASLDTAADQHAAEQAQAQPQATPEAAVQPASEPPATRMDTGIEPLSEQAEPAAPTIPTQPAAPTAPADMTDDQLRTRMQYLAGQFKGAVDRGVQKKIALERRAIEKEINARAKVAEQTTKETTNVPVEQPVSPGRNQVSAPIEPANQAGAAPTAQLDAAAKLPAAGRPVRGVGESVADGGGAAVAQPALTDEHAGKEFVSDTKARAYIAKNKIGATHYVKRIAPGEFEVRRRPGDGATMATAADKIAKQEEAVRKASESLAARKAEKEQQAAPATTIKEITGRNLGKGWRAFKPETGTLGIARAKMPQIASTLRGPLVNFLNARGTAHEHVEVPASELKPTQREFSPEKVAQSQDNSGGERSVLISSDNHVLDGHHQWLAQLGSDEPVKAIRLHAPIRELIDQVREFPSAETAATTEQQQTVANPTIQGDSNGIDQRPEQQPNGEKAVQRKQKASRASKEKASTKSQTDNTRVLTGQGELYSVSGEPATKGDNDENSKSGTDRSGVQADQEPRTIGGRAPRMGWAEQTRLRTKGGEPATIYRGASRALSAADFDSNALGHATSRPSSGLGVWFSANKEDAARYGDRVENFHLDIRNPKVYKNSDIPAFDSVQEAQAFARKLQSQGYDGIALDYRGLGGPLQFVAFHPDTVIQPNARSSYSVAGEEAASAISRLMQDKAGEATINVPSVGEVTIPYGDAKSGLAHIARRRGENFIPRVINLLQNGTVYEKEGQKGRIFLGHGADEAVLSLDRDGKAGTWLLSAYEKYPDLKAARLSEVAEERMPEGQYFTKEDLHRSLTSRGILGQVIASMVDAGVVKLHGGPGKLPGKAKNVKGVQAVTMPDGTIHMVASNLTPRTAFPVLMHEMFHQGGEKLIGTKEWGNLMGRMGSLYRQSERSSGKAREFYDRARARVDAARKKGAVGKAMEVEEFAAYAIEEYEKSPESLPAAIRKWVEDLIGMVKAWAVQRYGKQLGQVTPAQLAAFARWALMDVAVERRGEIFGPMGELFSVGTNQTDTPAFRKWFGDSKVVDENGAPLVVYHGTSARDDFTQFKTDNELGAHFGNVEQANYFADDVGTRVMPVYLRIENPVRLEDRGSFLSADVVPQLQDQGLLPEDFKAEAKGINFSPERERAKSAAIQSALKKAGFDGVVYHNTQEGSGNSYIAFDADQVKSAIGNNGEFDAANPDIRYSVAPDEEFSTDPVELTPPKQGALRSIQSAVQDSMSRVKQVQDRITKLAGRTISEMADYYLAETNRPGRIAARLEDAQNLLFKPLMERLAKSGFTPEQLSDLLHAQHAEERNAWVARINPKFGDTEKTPGSGMSDSVAQEIQRQHADDTELLAIAQQARDLARATLDLKLAYGLISQESYDDISTRYENYVPLKGDGEYGPKIKSAMGHEAREEHILENISRDYQQAVIVGEKNLARQSLLRLVLQNPDPDLWTVGVPPKGRYIAGKVYDIFKGSEQVASFTSKAQVQAFLEDRGANAGYTVRDSAGEQVKEFARPLQDNEVMVYVKGDPVRIQIGDEKLARQLRPIIESRDLTRWFIEKMRSLNRFKAAIYTGRNPAFIPRNMARDAMTGTLNMTGHHGAQVAAKAWAKYPSAFKGMLQYAATGKVPEGEFGKMLTEYRQHGGKVGASHMSDLEQQGKTLARMFDDAYGAGGFLRDGRMGKASWVASRKMIGGLAHGIEIVNQAAENALRLSLYATLRQQGATPAKAAQAAKTVTVDFDRKGEATGVLGALYLFINPAIQGTANMVKTLAAGEHKAQAWSLVGALTLAGMLTAGANMDDDKERWLGEEWDARTKNYIRYIGNRKISIPLSQEYSPFYAAGAALAEARRGESAMKSSLRLFSSFLDAYFPLQGAFHPDSDNHAADLAMATVPTAIRPHVESAFNRNSFGSQIVPENEQTKSRPDNLKMNRSTKGTVYDKAAQGIAAAGELLGAGKYENDITKVSPETLKHLWRTYTGGLGQFITDSAGLAALMGEDLSQVESSDVPIVKDFVKPQDVKAVRSRYYDLAKEAKAAQEEFRQAKKAGDDKAMDKIMGDAEKERLLGLAKTVTSTNKAAAALADEKVDVLADDSLSTAKKREKLKEIEKEEDELYRDAIDAFK